MRSLCPHMQHAENSGVGSSPPIVIGRAHTLNIRMLACGRQFHLLFYLIEHLQLCSYFNTKDYAQKNQSVVFYTLVIFGERR
jgi:hypothetical protein